MLPDYVEEHSGWNRPTARPILVEFQSVKYKEKIHTTFREEESRLIQKLEHRTELGFPTESLETRRHLDNAPSLPREGGFHLSFLFTAKQTTKRERE